MSVFGKFEGGELVLPGLLRPSDGKALTFRYLPGDLVLLKSAIVEHAIKPWYTPQLIDGEKQRE